MINPTDAGLESKIIKQKGFISISNQNLNKTLKTKRYSATVVAQSPPSVPEKEVVLWRSSGCAAARRCLEARGRWSDGSDGLNGANRWPEWPGDVDAEVLRLVEVEQMLEASMAIKRSWNASLVLR